MKDLFPFKDHKLLKYKVITTKKAISSCTEKAGRLTRLDERALKKCDEIGLLNSKKFELERALEEAKEELDGFDARLVRNRQGI